MEYRRLRSSGLRVSAAMDVLPKLTDDVMEKIGSILDAGPAM